MSNAPASNGAGARCIRALLRLHGSEIWVPERRELRPDPEVLAWHNENKFRG